MVIFKKFKVEELFEVVGKGTRITKQNREIGNVPLVTAGKENQGIAEYIKENKELFCGPVFTIDMFGNSFARDYEFYADDNIIVFKKDGLSINQYLYVVSALGHLTHVYGYGNQFRLNSIDSTCVHLPVKPGTGSMYSRNDVDWEYMESHIRELEESHIRELEAYLQETGLDNYKLTDSERSLLSCKPIFGKFKVEELFEVVGRGTRITKQNREIGNVPLVTAGKENQGIAEYIRENKKLFKGPVFTIDMFGNSFARDYEFYADDNIIVFGKDSLSINQYLYVVSALGHLTNVYGYGNQFRLNSVKNTHIQLPLKSGTDVNNYTEADIDWDYMEATIRAMEKQVIASVVEYKDKILATTKEVIA